MTSLLLFRDPCGCVVTRQSQGGRVWFTLRYCKEHRHE